MNVGGLNLKNIKIDLILTDLNNDKLFTYLPLPRHKGKGPKLSLIDIYRFPVKDTVECSWNMEMEHSYIQILVGIC